MKRIIVRAVDNWAPGIGYFLRKMRDDHIARQPAIPTPFGFRFAGSDSMATGLFEVEELELFRRCLKASKVCIDIGANIGLYSCLAAQSGVHVIAIEPLASNLRLLYRNLALNGFEAAEIYPVGLSKEAGVGHMFGRGTGASFVAGWAETTTAHPTIVPMTTLDILVGNRFAGVPITIKMDVEGFEYTALQGARATLALSPKPTWLVEICMNEHFPGGPNQRFLETFSMFWDYGYIARTADRDLRVVNRQDVIEWQTEGRVSFGSHNYLFTDSTNSVI